MSNFLSCLTMSTYPYFILCLVLLLYYLTTSITYETFTVKNKQTTREAVNGIKKRKQVLKNCKKDNIVVVLPSYDPKIDKQIDAMIKKKFEPDLVTVITFTDRNIIKEFLSSVYTETVNTFPAYFRINSSDSLIQHLNVVTDKPQVIESINTEVKKYKRISIQKKEAQKEKKENEKEDDKNKSIVNKAKEIMKMKPKEVLNKATDKAKNIGKNIGKKMGFGKK